jgi:Zn-dependent M32 family carboxypeptidase
MEVNGWRLYLHPLFQQQLEKLTAQVEVLQAKEDGLHSPQSLFLAVQCAEPNK